MFKHYGFSAMFMRARASVCVCVYINGRYGNERKQKKRKKERESEKRKLNIFYTVCLVLLQRLIHNHKLCQFAVICQMEIMWIPVLVCVSVHASVAFMCAQRLFFNSISPNRFALGSFSTKLNLRAVRLVFCNFFGLPFIPLENVCNWFSTTI